MFAKLALAVLPSFLKIFLYRKFYGAKIGRDVKIGFSLIDVENLELGDGSSIGHLNVVKGLARLSLGSSSRLGNLNWISGFPKNRTDFFQLDIDRVPELVVGNESSITNRHLIDCTGGVYIGSFVTFAGFRSQILTHSINVYESRQRALSVRIGDYSFVGTAVVILPGGNIADKAIVAAGSVVVGNLAPSFSLFAGVPAKLVKKIDREVGYFSREKGRVF